MELEHDLLKYRNWMPDDRTPLVKVLFQHSALKKDLEEEAQARKNQRPV